MTQQNKIRILLIVLTVCLSISSCAQQGTRTEQTYTQTEAYAETQKETASETLTDTVTETDTEVKADTEADTENKTDAETDTEDKTDAETNHPIKNIIFMIPDGAGFGTYDLANALKKTYGTGVKGQKTPVTTDAIQGMEVTGLYLDAFMIATADTSMASDYKGYATDSAAAGTALLGGYKTNYLMVGVNAQGNPRANLLELCRLEGKSTGFVTTKCLVDATPSDATAHSLKRADQDNCAYQFDVSLQMLNSGIDVLMAYGSDGGYIDRSGTILHNDRAAYHGYTVVSTLSEMNQAVYENKATKMWTNIHLPNTDALIDANPMTDYQGLHIPYDCNAQDGDFTLMDMAKAALEILSVNIADEDGFCLVIEGGAIDNAAETRYVREAVSEYLAFDEVFGYCVNWAMQRDDTIVIACPDHDSGGFYHPEDLDAVLKGLYDGSIGNQTVLDGAVTGHSSQNVPVWLYAPEAVRREILRTLHLPSKTEARAVRKGTFYDGTEIISMYQILNSNIAPAIVQAASLMTFDEASELLFSRANRYGTYDTETRTFTFKHGETIVSGTNVWKDAEGNEHPFEIGYAFWLTNHAEYTINRHHDMGTYPNLFYVPLSVLREMGYRQ